MDETSEADRVLQLQLRVGDVEVLERLLGNLRDGDWYTDEADRSWQWCYDIDANLQRWFIGEAYVFGFCNIGREREELRGAPITLSYYAWGHGLWRSDGLLGPYRKV